MPSLSTRERKAKFNTNDMIFRKKFNLTSGTLLSAEGSSAKYNFAESLESLTNKYKLFRTKSKQTFNFLNIPKKPFPLTSSEKYTMTKWFKDQIKGLKIILTGIKKTRTIERKEINEIKNETKRKLNMLDNVINNILGKMYVDLATLRLKREFF